MTKQEFLGQLRSGLSGFPQKELEERLCFYSEMIDDRMEDGCPEAAAVEAIGAVEDIVDQMIGEVSLTKLVREKITPKRGRKGCQTALLILGAPVWFPLLIAAFAVALALYVALWAVIIALWAVFASAAASGVCCLLAGIVLVCKSDMPAGLLLMAGGLVCAGLGIYLFFACRAATNGACYLARRLVLGIKNRLVKREGRE